MLYFLVAALVPESHSVKAGKIEINTKHCWRFRFDDQKTLSATATK